MTKRQQRAVERIRREAFRHGSHGDEPEGESRYEFKQFEVRDSGEHSTTLSSGETVAWTSRLVFVTSEVGLKGDEGTLAATYCRDYRHFAVGPRGAISLLNGKRKNVRGARCFFAETR